MRNTPTGVGKTQRHRAKDGTQWKHPHGRGEDGYSKMLLGVTAETPPRAWGRPSASSLAAMARRNTPTGVGKTFIASRDRLAR